MMPMALGMMVFSGLAPKVSTSLGIRTTMLVGIGTAGIGLLLLVSIASVAYLPIPKGSG